MPRRPRHSTRPRAWPEEHAELVRAYHRDLWPAFRDAIDPEIRHDVMYRSLLSLARQGYGVTECSIMFGVSHQRVSQWCEYYRLTKAFRALGSGTKPRRWDGRGFVAYDPMDDAQAHRHEVRARRQLERRFAIDELRRCAAALGRTPTSTDIDEWMGRPWQNSARLFRGRQPYDRPPCPWRSLRRRWYRLAGLEVRAAGYAGSLAPNATGKARKVSQ